MVLVDDPERGSFSLHQPEGPRPGAFLFGFFHRKKVVLGKQKVTSPCPSFISQKASASASALPTPTPRSARNRLGLASVQPLGDVTRTDGRDRSRLRKGPEGWTELNDWAERLG